MAVFEELPSAVIRNFFLTLGSVHSRRKSQTVSYLNLYMLLRPSLGLFFLSSWPQHLGWMTNKQANGISSLVEFLSCQRPTAKKCSLLTSKDKKNKITTQIFLLLVFFRKIPYRQQLRYNWIWTTILGNPSDSRFPRKNATLWLVLILTSIPRRSGIEIRRIN